MHSQNESVPTHRMTRRQEKANRILDAAAELILRWGYDKTTVDDIARQAGVAKGTIYLYWKTREELFLALIKRERLAFARDFQQRIMADEEGATLRGIIRNTALATMSRPLLKALLMGDRDVLGKLTMRELENAAYHERVEGFKVYLEALRERDMVRSDLSLREQVHAVSAIITGFFLGGPMMPEEFAVSDAESAELMADAVHRALAAERAVSPTEWEAISEAYMASVARMIDIEEELFLKEIESE